VKSTGGKSVLGKAAIGTAAGLAGVAATQTSTGGEQSPSVVENNKTISPVSKPTTDSKQYTPAAENSSTITKPTTVESQPVAVQHNEQLQRIIESITEEKTTQSGQSSQVDAKNPSDKLGIIGKTKKIASDVYPQSMLGKSITNTKNISGRVTSKLKDWKSMTARERYFDRMKNTTSTGIQTVKDKTSIVADKAKSLLSKGAGTAKKTSLGLKEKLGETKGSIGSPIGKLSPGFMSAINNLSPFFSTSTDTQNDNPTPLTGSLFKQSAQNNAPGNGKPAGKIQSILGSLGSNAKEAIPSLLKTTKNIPVKLTSLKQKIQQNRRSSKAIPTTSDLSTTSSSENTSENIATKTTSSTVQNKPTLQNRLKGTLTSASEKSKNILSNTVPLGERVKSSTLSGATRMKQFAKNQLESTNSTKNNSGTDSSTSPSNTVISNSTNSTSTTTINRYDTDVVSKWRNGYIENQHKPGNYS